MLVGGRAVGVPPSDGPAARPNPTEGWIAAMGRAQRGTLIFTLPRSVGDAILQDGLESLGKLRVSA